ncbi:MAG: S-adenosylmethionine decarboxylase [Candidatus Daviesbacteria bacterium]|nr:S-adenosylmethionine decarboxylase [Candidatus Daviesbacteria bacterium]
MRNIAPQITRQRLLIEGKFTIIVTQEKVKNYLLSVSKELDLRTYGDPIIYSPESKGKEENQGFDAFIPLIDSGIALYIWTNEKFMSCVLYTCKNFSMEKAIEFTKNFFQTTELEYQEF